MEENNDDLKKDQKIEIVKGNSKDLNISDVKDSLTFEVHHNDTRKNGEVIVPENLKDKPNEESDNQ